MDIYFNSSQCDGFLKIKMHIIRIKFQKGDVEDFITQLMFKYIYGEYGYYID